MFGKKYKLPESLTKQKIDIMHQNSLELIEKVGVNVPHEGLLNILYNYDGVKIEKSNVKFSNELVEKALREAKYDLPDYKKENFIISSGAHQTLVLDMNTEKYRPSTLKDLIDLTKLCDALDTTGSAPVVPLDIPVYLQEIMMHKVSFEHSRYKCNDIYEHMDKPTYESANYIYEMAKVAKKRFTLGVWMMSPRNFDRNNLDVVYKYLDKGIPMWVATMPVSGVTAPITTIGTIQQSMFEVFAGLTLLNLVNNKGINYISIDDAFEADCFDMKYTTFVYASPEYMQANLHRIALMKYYNMPIMVKSLLTTSKKPDIQAGCEIGQCTLICALAGARAFRCGGLLSTDEVYSAEQLVVVHEIVKYVENILKEREFSQEKLMVDEIKEVGIGQSFISRESTVNNFRNEYQDPDLFIHTNLSQWEEMGSRPISDYAKDIARKKIAEHNYMINDDIKKELDKIYQVAKNDKKLEESFKYKTK